MIEFNAQYKVAENCYFAIFKPPNHCYCIRKSTEQIAGHVAQQFKQPVKIEYERQNNCLLIKINGIIFIDIGGYNLVTLSLCSDLSSINPADGSGCLCCLAPGGGKGHSQGYRWRTVTQFRPGNVDGHHGRGHGGG